MSPASDFATALRCHPRRVLAGVLAVMVLETAVVLLSALQRPPTLVLSVALASDIVLLGALAVWASGGVRRWGLTPGKGLRTAALGVLVFSGVMRLLGIPGPALLLPLALAAEATLACVVLLSFLRVVRWGCVGPRASLTPSLPARLPCARTWTAAVCGRPGAETPPASRRWTRPMSTCASRPRSS